MKPKALDITGIDDRRRRFRHRHDLLELEDRVACLDVASLLSKMPDTACFLDNSGIVYLPRYVLLDKLVQKGI